MSFLAYPPPVTFDAWLEGNTHEEASCSSDAQLQRQWQLKIAGFQHEWAAQGAQEKRKWTSHLIVSPEIIVGLKTSKINFSENPLGVLSIISSVGFLGGDGIIEACAALRNTQSEDAIIWENPQIIGLQVDGHGSTSFFTHNPQVPPSHPSCFTVLSKDDFRTLYHQTLLHLHNGHPFSSQWETIDPKGYEIHNPLRKELQTVPTIAHGIHIIHELLKTCSSPILEVLQSKPMVLKSKSSNQTVWTSQYLLEYAQS